MNLPMHRFKYTQLTKDQIYKKLEQAANGPSGASKFTDCLAGKSIKIVTDNGPVLNYKFNDSSKLTMTEDKEAAIECGYGALDLTPLVLFSHLIPKTQKGFNVIIDLDTNLATVFEVWMSSGRKEKTLAQKEVTVDDREVQRQIYYGYVEVAGKEAPKERHHLTNRLEGKGVHWKQDNGVEVLDLYPSIMSTNFIELTRHIDDLSYCAPSDYIIINDNLFIYNRTECEFSGIHTMYAIDLFAMKQVGVRFGFNEDDNLEYYLFRGNGKVVGQLAYLESFADHGDKIDLGGPADQKDNPPPAPKGSRVVYRPLRDFPYFTEQQMHEAAEECTEAFVDRADIPQMMAGNALPYSNLLAGKEFTLKYDNDGPVWNYRIKDKENLEWKKEGESAWHKESYRAFEADEKLVFFSHLHSGSRPRQCVQIALDLTNGLTTCIESKMGTKYFGNEVSYNAIFGIAEMKGLTAPAYMRHSFTDELVGKAYSWSYSDQMTSMHVYTTPHSSSWTIFLGSQALGMQWCAPCIYVKLRPGVYIFCLTEEACNGAETCVCINTNIMHDCGFGLMGGMLMNGSKGVNLGPIGAIARHIGDYDINDYFGPKKRIN